MTKLFAVIMLCAVFLTGCKTIPMPSYENQPVTNHNNQHSMQSIEKAIVRGALSLGWIPTVVNEGLIEAKLDIRQHQLVVMIEHDTETFSIKYKDSKNLKYNGKKIHRQYANWVTNLIRAINVQTVAG